MSELTLSVGANGNSDENVVMFPRLYSSDYSDKTYQGTVPFKNDRAYTHMVEGGLLNRYSGASSSNTDEYPYGPANMRIHGWRLVGGSGTFGEANRIYTEICGGDYFSYRLAYGELVTEVFCSIILFPNTWSQSNLYNNPFSFTHYRSNFPATVINIHKIGDCKVFDLPFKCYRSANGSAEELVVYGNLKVRVGVNYMKNLASLSSETSETYKRGVHVVIDSKFTGTISESGISPTISFITNSSVGKRIVDYNSAETPTSIPSWYPNDIETCDYTD